MVEQLDFIFALFYSSQNDDKEFRDLYLAKVLDETG
jgi:hypothetical protein